jgi:hypothetical protein
LRDDKGERIVAVESTEQQSGCSSQNSFARNFIQSFGRDPGKAAGVSLTGCAGHVRSLIIP